MAKDQRDKLKHPLQPAGFDAHGVWRFKQNKIVSLLLDYASERGLDLNRIAQMGFSNDDQTQLAQLIGYSVAGSSQLPYISDAAYALFPEPPQSKPKKKARRNK